MHMTLSSCFSRILVDPRVSIYHIGTYLALVLLWDKNQQANPVRVSRRRIMAITRTRSIATYHKYIKELVCFGYIDYQPSYHPREGSRIWIK